MPGMAIMKTCCLLGKVAVIISDYGAERIGAVSDRFLQCSRPMNEARLLWEIGHDGAEVRELRSRLGIDSGYLSRVLRSLERQGLVMTRADREDQRVRRASLTRAGLHERKELDRRSNELALSILEALSARQRDRLSSKKRLGRKRKLGECNIATSRQPASRGSFLRRQPPPRRRPELFRELLHGSRAKYKYGPGGPCGRPEDSEASRHCRLTLYCAGGDTRPAAHSRRLSPDPPECRCRTRTCDCTP